MKLLTFAKDGQIRLGARVGDLIVDLNASYAHLLAQKGSKNAQEEADAALPDDMRSFLEGGEEALKSAWEVEEWVLEKGGEGAATFAPDEVRLKAPILNPHKIICIGLNYRDHCDEYNIPLPTDMHCFAKFNTCIVGPEEPIVRPKVVRQLDWEGELALVIGRKGMNIAQESVFDHISGYMCFNDISAREFPSQGQLLLHKALDTSAPMGPYLVSSDEVGDPHDLNIRLEVNGKAYQDSNTSNMFFKIPYIVSFISQVITLEPGDVISTGTPAGVGKSCEPPVFLKEGDRVTLEIEGLGRLSNPVVDQP